MTFFGKLRNAGLAGIALSALAAQPASAEDKEIKVGMVNLSLCCAYFVGMDAAVKDEASHFSNVKVLSTDAKGDVAKLTSNVEDLLSQKVDGLIISSWEKVSPVPLASTAEPGRSHPSPKEWPSSQAKALPGRWPCSFRSSTWIGMVSLFPSLAGPDCRPRGRGSVAFATLPGGMCFNGLSPCSNSSSPC